MAAHPPPTATHFLAFPNEQINYSPATFEPHAGVAVVNTDYPHPGEVCGGPTVGLRCVFGPLAVTAACFVFSASEKLSDNEAILR